MTSFSFHYLEARRSDVLDLAVCVRYACAKTAHDLLRRWA